MRVQVWASWCRKYRAGEAGGPSRLILVVYPHAFIEAVPGNSPTVFRRPWLLLLLLCF